MVDVDDMQKKNFVAAVDDDDDVVWVAVAYVDKLAGVYTQRYMEDAGAELGAVMMVLAALLAVVMIS